MSVGSSFRRNAYQRLERGGHAAVRDDDLPDSDIGPISTAQSHRHPMVAAPLPRGSGRTVSMTVQVTVSSRDPPDGPLPAAEMICKSAEISAGHSGFLAVT